MVLSFILYIGLLLLGADLLLLIPRRTRRIGRRGSAVGFVMTAAALLWPVPEKHVLSRVTRLDELMPVFQFDERHETQIAAPPQRVYEAAHAVRADEILLFRTLTAIRRLGRPGPESILNAPERQPLLDVATRTTFRYLADDPREIVVATTLIPNAAEAMMNFLITPDGRGGTLLSTETRVHATTDDARRRFTTYWRFIRPGSDIIRRMWLRAVKRRAEHPSTSSPTPRG